MATLPKKRDLSTMMDPQFEFPEEIPDWRQQGGKQKVMGTNFIQIKPYYELQQPPKVIEFELLDLDHYWAMGPNTRFRVKGVFQVMTPAKDETPAIPWANCTTDELDKVIVQPNWFESLFRIEMFYGQNHISSSEEPPEIIPYLNAWKYNYMDKTQKKKLFPQDCHPAYGVPSKIGEWDMDNADGEWRKNYGPKIFTGKLIEFDFVPQNTPPFFQGSNYLEHAPKIWPMPFLDRTTIQFIFTREMDSIFKKSIINEKMYRFILTDMSLVVEQLKLSNNLQFTLPPNKKGMLTYPGVTKITRYCEIPPSTNSFPVKLGSVFLPEGMFIFAVPKGVLKGKYMYDQNLDGNVFSKHNLRKVHFTFGGHSFFLDSIDVGDFCNDIIEKKLFYDYLTSPPFGMTMDQNKITQENIVSGGKNTPYPHVYINFCNYGNKSRILPVVDDGSILKNKRDLEVVLTFDEKGAPNNIVFYVVMFYTDNNLILNLPREKPNKMPVYFSSPYDIRM